MEYSKRVVKALKDMKRAFYKRYRNSTILCLPINKIKYKVYTTQNFMKNQIHSQEK